MSRHAIVLGALRCAVSGGAVALCASFAQAQVSGPPSIMQPKQAAQRAAGAVNAHTTQMESPQDAPARPVAQTSPRTGTPSTPAANAQQSPRSAAKPPATGVARTAGAARRTRPDSAEAAISTSVSKRGARSEISLSREVFTYDKGGRRDPFLSLITSGELRPMISDLKLVTVIYDVRGRSVAILRDVSTKQQYRVKVGHTLGRMRVGSIQPKSVTFTVDEFGFSRQEILALGDPSKERTQ